MRSKRPVLNVVEIRAIKIDVPEWIEQLDDFCIAVLDDLGKKNWNVSVLLCDDGYIRGLNGKYRGIFEPTDVLSFSQDSNIYMPGPYYAGDIVVSTETMARNAIEQKTTEKCEMKRLLVHGLLHLAGMDHEEDEVEGGMLDLQESILRKHSGV